MLSPFEYITVLLSIILGMGIARLMTGIAGVVSRWERTTLYLPHTILVVLVFILHIQEWWALFELRDFSYWRLPVFLFISLYPINLYLLSHLLFPARWPKGAVDLPAFYYRHYRRILGFIGALIVLSVLDNVWISRYGLQDQILQGSLLFIITAFLFIRQPRPWMHYALALLLATVTLLTLWFTWDDFLLQP